MYIHKIKVKNFRLLLDSELALEEKTTLIVGRNNSGKTSLAEVMRRFLADSSATFQSSTTARGGGLNVPPRRGLTHRVAFTEVILLATRVDPVVAHVPLDL